MRDVMAWVRSGQPVTVVAAALGVAFVSAVLLVSDSLAVSAIAVPAGVALIANTVAMRVRAFAAELGVLHEAGVSRKQLRRLVLRRAIVAGSSGAALGCAAGLGVAAGHGIAGHVVAGLAVAFALGVAATLVAAWTVTRRVLAPSPGRPVRAWLGIVLLVAAGVSNADFPGRTFLLWLGLILVAPLLTMVVTWPVASLMGTYGGARLRLASRDAMRQPRRTAGIASSFVTGVALVIAFASVGTLPGLVVLVAAFDIGRAMAQAGRERREEIVLLLAVGASRSYIWRAVRQGSTMIAVCGSLLGAGLGVLLSGVLHLQPLRGLVIPWPAVLVMLAVLAVAAAVAVWWPVARAVQPLSVPALSD